MLHVVVQADNVRVDKALPRVFSLYLAEALFLLIDPIESLLVRVGNLRLGLLINPSNAPSVHPTPGCLHLKLFKNVIGSIDVWLALSIDLKYFTALAAFTKQVVLFFVFLDGSLRLLRLPHLSGNLVHAFQITVHWIDHFEARGEEGIGLAGYGHKIRFSWLEMVMQLLVMGTTSATFLQKIVCLGHFNGEVALNPSLIFMRLASSLIT